MGGAAINGCEVVFCGIGLMKALADTICGARVVTFSVFNSGGLRWADGDFRHSYSHCASNIRSVQWNATCRVAFTMFLTIAFLYPRKFFCVAQEISFSRFLENTWSTSIDLFSHFGLSFFSVSELRNIAIANCYIEFFGSRIT